MATGPSKCSSVSSGSVDAGTFRAYSKSTNIEYTELARASRAQVESQIKTAVI